MSEHMSLHSAVKVHYCERMSETAGELSQNEARLIRAEASVESDPLRSNSKESDIFISKLINISTKSDKNNELPDRCTHMSEKALLSTPNYAPCEFDLSMSNCFESGSSTNDCFRHRLQDSVSSDPEVYAKSPTATKLNVQIKKLKNDMLALRSTTSSYKVYMNKIFDELKTIATMYDEGATQCHFDDYDPRVKISIDKDSAKEENYKVSTSKADHDNFKEGERKTDDAQTLSNNIDFTSANVYRGFEDRSLPTSSQTCESASNQVKFNKPHHDLPHPAHQSLTSKLKKLTERPNSDPLATCSSESTKIFSQTPNNTDSFAKKYSVKSADSSLETNSKQLKANLEGDRVYSILTKCNIVPNKNLRISECSIDSGYQGSSATSPRDKLGGEIGPHVATPASPVNGASPVITNSNQTPKQTDTSNPLAGSNKPLGVDSSNSQQKCFQAIFRSDCQKDVGSNSKDLEAVDETAASEPVPIIKKPENPVVQIPHRQNGYLLSPTSNKSNRPIPKQRTVFTSFRKDVPETDPNRSNSNNKANESTVNKTDIGFVSRESIKDIGDSISNDESKFLNDSNSDKQSSTQPKRPQRLAIIHPNSHAPIDLGSPQQRRVKLGVSAIKQLTPGNEKKGGSLFYCVGQAPRGNDVPSRPRKAVNAKQLLREKYAAAIERSSRAAAKKEGAPASCESEWSMVRRRSMRMMTEFQIFDFKDNAEEEKSSPNVRRKAIVVGETTKSKQKLDLSCVKSKHDEIEIPACKKYSVSPSAAIVSKQVFETESKLENNSRQLKSSTQISRKSKKCTDEPPRYAAHPLPPPPPSPPRTPPAAEEESLKTVNKLNTPAELIKTPVFATPVLRPKASVPSELHLDGAKPTQPCFNGLKLSPNSKSAFTPVASISVSNAGSQGSLNGNQDSVVSSSKNNADSGDKMKADMKEKKRRMSLPQALLSNKQRFLNEFMPNAPSYTQDTSTSPASDLQRHASLCASRRKPEPIDCVISTETSTVTGYKVPELSAGSNSRDFATTEPLSCEIPKDASPDARRDTKHRRHTSGDKARTSSMASANQRTSLEHQPVRFNRSERIADVVGALRTAGYLPSSELLQSSNKASHQNATTSSSNNKLSREDKSAGAPARQRGRHHFPVHPGGQMQACYKARSSSSLHQYETVKLMDSGKVDSKLRNKRLTSKDAQTEDIARSSASRSHKSTIAMIRDSLLGRREKSRSSTTDSKHPQAVNGGKVRSSSVGDKLKINESSFFETKFSKGKKKEAKSKKEKSDSKTSRKENASNKNASKIAHNVSQAATPSEEAFIFPDPNQVVYGTPDSEVLERFLAAAAAAASDTPRSPLQRLRSSFRTPKNKNKILQESRIRDDTDIVSASYNRDCATRKNTNVHNGQEFTYV